MLHDGHFLDKHIAHEADYPVLFYLKVGVMMTITMKIFLTMATTSRACSPPTFPPTPQVLFVIVLLIVVVVTFFNLHLSGPPSMASPLR